VTAGQSIAGIPSAPADPPLTSEERAFVCEELSAREVLAAIGNTDDHGDDGEEEEDDDVADGGGRALSPPFLPCCRRSL